MACVRWIAAFTVMFVGTCLRAEPPELFTHTVPLPSPSPPAGYWMLMNVGINHEAIRQPARQFVLDLPGRDPEIAELVAFSPRAGFIQMPDPDDPTGFGTITIPDPDARPEDFAWHWYGRSPNYTIALNVYKGILAGRISGPGYDRYALFPIGGGITRLGYVNPGWWRSHPEGDGLGLAPASLRNFAAVPREATAPSTAEVPPPMPSGGGWDATCSGPPPSGQHVIDVLVLYTQNVLDRYGSHDGVTAQVQLALQDANLALRNSGVQSVTFSLRGPEFIPNPGGQSYDAMNIIQAIHLFGGTEELSDFPYIGFPGNPYVSARRDAMWADIVALARHNPGDGTCGYSWIPRQVVNNGYPSEPGPDWQKFGYLVFDPECNADRFNLAHELGHQLGMEHDPRNSEVPGMSGIWTACPWAYSHRRGDDVPERFRFRTIGGEWEAGPGSSGSPYFCGPGNGDPAFCPLIDAYSTPLLQWTGFAQNGGGPPYGLQPLGTVAGAQPIGVAVHTSQQLRANAADTMLRLAPVAAAFRARPEQIFANGFQ